MHHHAQTICSEFRWLERGDGEPVVFLHGLMGRMDHWEETLDALESVCRPIALSLPILDVDLPEASIEEVGRYVVRFLDALDLPRAVIGGNSLGGHVALEMGLSHGDRVSGLILTGSSGLFERSFTRGVPHRPSGTYVREKMEEIFFDPCLVTAEWVESVRRGGDHARLGAPGDPVRSRRQAPQPRGSSRFHRDAGPPRVGAERSDHLPRRRRALSRSSPGLPARLSLELRPRPDAGTAGSVQRRGGRVARGHSRQAWSGPRRRCPVIPRLVAPALDWYAGHRRHQLEAVWRRPGDVQEVALRSLLWSAADTEFGLEHGFRSIRTVAQYQERVPIREYADFKPLWSRARWRGPGA